MFEVITEFNLKLKINTKKSIKSTSNARHRDKAANKKPEIDTEKDRKKNYYFELARKKSW